MFKFILAIIFIVAGWIFSYQTALNIGKENEEANYGTIRFYITSTEKKTDNDGHSKINYAVLYSLKDFFEFYDVNAYNRFAFNDDNCDNYHIIELIK